MEQQEPLEETDMFQAEMNIPCLVIPGDGRYLTSLGFLSRAQLDERYLYKFSSFGFSSEGKLATHAIITSVLFILAHTKLINHYSLTWGPYLRHNHHLYNLRETDETCKKHLD